MTTKKKAPTFCEKYGHSFETWTPSIVPNFRKCRRDGCHATQRLQAGRWVDGPATVVEAVQNYQQVSMWEG